MKVLLTGSEGFIGRHVALRLLAEGHSVCGLSIEERSAIDHPAYDYHRIDVLDAAGLESFFSANQFDAFIHLAALTTHEEIVGNKEKALRTNLEGALNVLKEFKRSPATKFIFASTGKVYGKIERLPIPETHPPTPRNILGKSKYIAENLIDFYAYDRDKQCIVLRIFNVYGHGLRDYFLIPTILRQVLKEGKTEITLGNITDKRDYVYVEDLVDAFSVMVRAPLPNGFHIFNVGNGVPISAAQIVEAIGEILGKKIIIQSDPTRGRPDEFPEEYADIAKIGALGWKPAHDLRAGLEKTISAYRSAL